jgi:hypothetical protein
VVISLLAELYGVDSSVASYEMCHRPVEIQLGTNHVFLYWGVYSVVCLHALGIRCERTRNRQDKASVTKYENQRSNLSGNRLTFIRKLT